MRVLVTGGTGFLGRAAVAALLDDGHTVRVLTRQAAPAGLPDGVVPLRADLADGSALARAFADFRPAALVHLAWEGLPDYSEAQSRRNLELGLALFAAAAEAGVAHILAAGSSWEYVSRRGGLAEDEPLEYAKPFPAAKNMLRRLGSALARDRGMRFHWLRVFFAYGPGQRPGSLIPGLLAAARSGREPDVRSPWNRNDFVHVSDVGRAFALVLGRAPAAEVYNVGSGAATAVADVARLVYAALKRPLPAGLDRAPPADARPEDFWADISRLAADAGFAPRIGLAEGVGDLARAGAANKDWQQ
jgi:nucleoside-diphosphate-sugar epimerase